MTGCKSSKSSFLGKSGGSKKSAPSGKYRNPRLFSGANPFQGGAKMKLTKSKKKKIKLLKKKHKQKGKYRRAPKPGRTFEMKRTLSRISTIKKRRRIKRRKS